MYIRWARNPQSICRLFPVCTQVCNIVQITYKFVLVNIILPKAITAMADIRKPLSPLCSWQCDLCDPRYKIFIIYYPDIYHYIM